ncbi:aspartyl-tRNA(Asn) amidotransferase subunit A [Halalkalibacter wakoensis JCM 9140]|uniref:Aspartyl-tRNA(Asn) amidotransferase subunit A n=1 Tax=Halalkalibacter wakoensis JCM 9140 TaxID=1236970 RepID=W4Q873_9BACI|nr:aspartyl-tRNA(Asn) amidotransferase subunit A [Halalkalibacter wakoensis JCM 9140]
MSLFDHKMSELHTMLLNKEVKVSDLVDESYKRIADVDDKVKAFVTLDEEKARAYAAELDEHLAQTANVAFYLVCQLE